MKDLEIILTKEGLEKIKQEIEERKTKTRKEIADEIDHAQQQGDLSENASYKAAMEKKEMNEAQILKLEETMQKATVVEEKEQKGKINMGSKVRLKNLASDKEFSYQIVGQNEADPISGKISIQSPLGAAMVNKRKGSRFRVDMPAGKTEFEILEAE
jgi:transcription elongation factor GreA